MKLYGSFTSPYARKARILLKEKSIDCDFIEERPGEAGTRFSQLNPLGKVPVLEIDETSALYDSPVIVEYLDQLTGDPLIPVSGDSRWEVQRLHALADGMLDATVSRFLELRRPEQSRMDEAIEKQELKISSALASLSNATKNREYLVGDEYSFADLAVGVALEYIDFRYAHDWRNRFPVLAFWLGSISVRPSFMETIPPGMENSARPRH